MIKFLLILLIFTGCARFSDDYEDDEPVARPKITPTMTDEQIIKALEGVNPDLISVNKMQWSCCRDLCRGVPYNVSREPRTKYIRCSCSDGRMFRVTRLRGKTVKK